MSKAVIGRLILEASTGMHGEESRILADAWADMAQQRAELLEVLKGMKDAFCNPESGELDKRLAVQDMNIAVTKAEAAE